jgi:hypothetical protein
MALMTHHRDTKWLHATFAPIVGVADLNPFVPVRLSDDRVLRQIENVLVWTREARTGAQ